MRIEFECAMIRVEVRSTRDYPDLLDDAEELFEVDPELRCNRMAKVLANRLMALHGQQEFVVSVEIGSDGATERSG